MPYTPPVGSAVNFAFTAGGYSPPVGSAVNFNFHNDVSVNLSSVEIATGIGTLTPGASISFVSIISSSGIGSFVGGDTEAISLVAVSAASQIGSLSVSISSPLTGISSSTQTGIFGVLVLSSLTGRETHTEDGILAVSTGSAFLVGVESSTSEGSFAVLNSFGLVAAVAATQVNVIGVEVDTRLTGVEAQSIASVLAVTETIALPSLQVTMGAGVFGNDHRAFIVSIESTAEFGTLVGEVSISLIDTPVGTEFGRVTPKKSLKADPLRTLVSDKFRERSLENTRERTVTLLNSHFRQRTL